METLYREPVVKVIGHTMFHAVPKEMLPDRHDDEALVKYQVQDEGSYGARLAECAGRVCYDSYGKGRASEDYHENILKVGHGSVLEHSTINYFISTVSRNLTHELVRHRVGVAISQRSTRYVEESESAWAWHPLMNRLHDAPGLRADLEACQQWSRSLYSRVVVELQGSLERQGMDGLTARKQARGAARGILGTCLETELVWTANLRALRNIIEQRCNDFADAEIRMLAFRLWEEGMKITPEYLSDYTPRPAKDGMGMVLDTPYRKV